MCACVSISQRVYFCVNMCMLMSVRVLVLVFVRVCMCVRVSVCVCVLLSGIRALVRDPLD